MSDNKMVEHWVFMTTQCFLFERENCRNEETLSTQSLQN